MTSTQLTLFAVPDWRDQCTDPGRVHDPRCMLDPRHHRLTACAWWGPGRDVDRVGWWAWLKAGAPDEQLAVVASYPNPTTTKETMIDEH